MSVTPEELKILSEIERQNIGEAVANVPAAVENVRKLLSERHPNLVFPPDLNELVARCLRVRKFNEDQASTQVNLFFELIRDLYKLHNNISYFMPSTHKEYFLDSFGFCKLKQRDPKGRVVIIANFDKLPAEFYSIDKGLSLLLHLLNELTKESVDTQRIGIVFACNFRGYELKHAMQYTLSRIRVVTRMIKKSLPVRFKQFHIIRCPALFTYTYSLIKPFLNEKMKNRIYFHGKDLTEFHKHLPPEIMPEVFGGALSNECAIDTDFTNFLCSKDDYYKDYMKYGYTNLTNEAS